MEKFEFYDLGSVIAPLVNALNRLAEAHERIAAAHVRLADAEEATSDAAKESAHASGILAAFQAGAVNAALQERSNHKPV